MVRQSKEKQRGRFIKKITTGEQTKTVAATAVLLLALPVAYIGFSDVFRVSYTAPLISSEEEAAVVPAPVEPVFVATHIPTPEPLKAIYMSQCVVGTPSFREDLVSLIEETELNAVVIDIKDFSGKLGFTTDHPDLVHAVSDECGAVDIEQFIDTLHEKEIYVIGRITVFQDPYYTSLRPDLAVKRASDGATWTDYKGLSFIDVGAREFWDYIITLSKESYAVGFDELNFDYIRFPSDGNMKDIKFDHSDGNDKATSLEHFFAYLHDQLKDTGAILSADIFGMTTTNTDDLNIGQVLERTLPYFDYVAPMVYPSHYPRGFNGWSNPNHYPHEVIEFSMRKAHDRAVATTTTVQAFGSKLLSTTTPIYSKPAYSPLKLRPWLQDFDYGGNYGPEEVRTQIEATYDAGLTSWMLWAPSNRYTRGALEPFYKGAVE